MAGSYKMFSNSRCGQRYTPRSNALQLPGFSKPVVADVAVTQVHPTPSVRTKLSLNKAREVGRAAEAYTKNKEKKYK
jgi:hypothetical protein